MLVAVGEIFSILLPKGSYLKLTVPPVPGSVTLLRRFSKSQKYCVVPLEFTFVEVFPLLSSDD
jgi:hypothetical protein